MEMDSLLEVDGIMAALFTVKHHLRDTQICRLFPPSQSHSFYLMLSSSCAGISGHKTILTLTLPLVKSWGLEAVTLCTAPMVRSIGVQCVVSSVQ